jgi:hypothetical protein
MLSWGVRSSGTPAEGEDLRHIVSRVYRFHPMKTRLSCKESWVRSRRNQRHTITRAQRSKEKPQPGPLNRPRTECSTSKQKEKPLKRPCDSKEPGTYKKALTNVKAVIFKEKYSTSLKWMNTT